MRRISLSSLLVILCMVAVADTGESAWDEDFPAEWEEPNWDVNDGTLVFLAERPAQVHRHAAVAQGQFGGVDGAAHHLADHLLVLVVDRVPFRFTNLLDDHLLGRLSGDPAEGRCIHFSA